MGLENFSNQTEVKKAFRKLAVIYHPDKYKGSSEKFLSIYEAYSYLSDSDKKRDYDKELSEFLEKKYETPSTNYNKFVNEEFERKKEVFNSLNSEELEIFFRIIKGNIPDIFFSLFLLGIGGFFIVMSFSAPESFAGTILGLVIGIPLTIVGIRDVSLVLKIKEFKKTYPLVKDA